MAMLVISYSRVDRPLVRGLVSLLRAAYTDVVDEAVFWDEDFEPGEDWFEQFTTAVDAAPRIFVCWCQHSSKSTQVRREFTYALAQGKKVIPVLLDDTTLHAKLRRVHGVDLRETALHALVSGASRTRPSPSSGTSGSSRGSGRRRKPSLDLDRLTRDTLTPLDNPAAASAGMLVTGVLGWLADAVETVRYPLDWAQDRWEALARRGDAMPTAPAPGSAQAQYDAALLQAAVEADLRRIVEAFRPHMQ